MKGCSFEQLIEVKQLLCSADGLCVCGRCSRRRQPDIFTSLSSPSGVFPPHHRCDSPGQPSHRSSPAGLQTCISSLVGFSSVPRGQQQGHVLTGKTWHTNNIIRNCSLVYRIQNKDEGVSCRQTLTSGMTCDPVHSLFSPTVVHLWAKSSLSNRKPHDREF